MSDNNATADANDSRPNSSCPVCPQGECLCEVEIQDTTSNITYLLKSNDIKQSENKQILTNSIIFYGAGKSQNDPILDIRYRVLGECEGKPDQEENKDEAKTGESNFIEQDIDGECVSIFIQEYSDLVPYSGNEASKYSKNLELYNTDIAERIQSSDIFKASKECQQFVDYKKQYDPGKRVLVSLDKEQNISYMVNTIVADPVGNLFRFFLRGFNLFVLGNINSFPANIYRFGIITCDGKAEKKGIEHYTDFVVLPNYKIEFKGILSFSRGYTATSQEDAAQITLIATETVNHVKGDEVRIDYKKLREEHAKLLPLKKEEQKEKNLGEKIWDKLFGFGDFLSDMTEHYEDVLDERASELEEAVRGGITANVLKRKPPLFSIQPHTPKLVFGAEAKLDFDAEKKLEINRDREKSEEKVTERDEEKPTLPNGVVNVPVAKDLPIKAEYEQGIKKEIETYQNSYLRFDPFVGGTFAINLIQMIGVLPIPALKGAIEFLNTIDFDIFTSFKGDDLKWDQDDRRTRKLRESREKKVDVKAFFFCSMDLSFSPVLMLHTAKQDELGATIELRGSFGLGIAAGAFLEVNISIIQIQADIQGSYGVRTYFSIDFLSGNMKFWHDGIGGPAKVESGLRGEWKNDSDNDSPWGARAQSSGVEVTDKGGGYRSSHGTSSDQSEGNRENSTYDPKVDQDYDNPYIKIYPVYKERIWPLSPAYDEHYRINLPNRVSRYVTEYYSDNDVKKYLGRMFGGSPEDKEQFINDVFKQYDDQVKRHEKAKGKYESGYWIPPSSFANPSWTYKLGVKIHNEVPEQGGAVLGTAGEMIKREG